jgi:hypothetical protein
LLFHSCFCFCLCLFVFFLSFFFPFSFSRSLRNPQSNFLHVNSDKIRRSGTFKESNSLQKSQIPNVLHGWQISIVNAALHYSRAASQTM